MTQQGKLKTMNFGTPLMNFIATSKFQRNSPTDYKGKLHLVSSKKDTWWIVTSQSYTSKIYMCHIHMKLFTVDVGHTDKCGRIDCECPSFIYCKYTPRHCKHTIELARQFFGEKSFQYDVLVKSQQDKTHDPDEWCSENYKVEEEITKKAVSKARLHRKQLDKLIADGVARGSFTSTGLIQK